jgi:hypothetical protein
MTSQSPRIYTYKITFEEVPYYYYGMHEEKVYDEEYWGSPYTHKWCWEFYTPKKQILETFSNREDAGEVERRLIKPVYNTDKWCLNANCAGVFSLDTCSKAGKKGGRKTSSIQKQIGSGFYSMSAEEIKKYASIGGKKTVELGLGVHSLTKEQKIEAGKKGAEVHRKNNTGFYGQSKEERIERGKKMAKLGIGVHSLTKEEKSQIGKKAYENKTGIHALTTEERSEIGKKISSQKWMCEETGYITNAGSLSHYQRKRGIDTSKRRRIS